MQVRGKSGKQRQQGHEADDDQEKYRHWPPRCPRSGNFAGRAAAARIGLPVKLYL
jgi:hypothetical protein